MLYWQRPHSLFRWVIKDLISGIRISNNNVQSRIYTSTPVYEPNTNLGILPQKKKKKSFCWFCWINQSLLLCTSDIWCYTVATLCPTVTMHVSPPPFHCSYTSSLNYFCILQDEMKVLHNRRLITLLFRHNLADSSSDISISSITWKSVQQSIRALHQPIQNSN